MNPTYELKDISSSIFFDTSFSLQLHAILDSVKSCSKTYSNNASCQLSYRLVVGIFTDLPPPKFYFYPLSSSRLTSLRLFFIMSREITILVSSNSCYPDHQRQFQSKLFITCLIKENIAKSREHRRNVITYTEDASGILAEPNIPYSKRHVHVFLSKRLVVLIDKIDSRNYEC